MLARVATPCLLFVVAIVFRILSWHSVFQQGGVYPHGNDAYYHLRRIRHSIEHFPSVLDFDPLINFPQGGEPIWPATFDWAIAAILRLWPGIEAPGALEPIAVWVPPLLGAATVVGVYAIGTRFFSRAAGVLAGALLAVLPAHVLYSRLGALDHHVAVAGIVTMMLAAAMVLLRGAPGRTAGPFAVTGPEAGGAQADPGGARVASAGIAGGLAASFWLGAAMGVAVLVWPGTLLHVGLLQALLVVRLFTAPDVERARAWALRFAIVHATAALVVAPFAWGREWQVWGAMSPVVLTSFQPIYFFGAALCFGGVGLAWSRDRVGDSRATRLLSGVAIGGVGIAAAFLFVPGLAASIGDALAWFSKQEAFQSVVNESVPLFAGARGPARASAFLGWLVFLVPPMLVYVAVVHRDRPEILLLVGWGAGLFGATLVQWRFMNSYSVAHALLFAITLDGLGRRLAGEGASAGAGAGRDRLRVAAALGILALALLPSFRSYGPQLDNWRRSLRGLETVPIGMQRHARLVADAARHLRDISPTPDLEAYSVLGPWGDGHILKYVAGRPVVQDNFGDDAAPENFRRADAYFSARSEEAALEVVAPLATRYVLVRSTGSGQSTGYARDSLFRRLHLRRGTGGGRPPLEPLERHRLVYQSEPIDPGESEPYCQLFEIVPGAEIVGRASPGAIVTARLSIEPRRGSGFVYETRTVADEVGTWALRVPYSNEPPGDDVRTGFHYGIRSGGRAVTLRVPEAAVTQGLRIEAPALDG